MADEARVTNSVAVLKRTGTVTQIDRRYSGSFTYDASRGPAPGLISVSLTGTDVDLSGLISPGVCVLTNQSATDYVDVGVYEPSTGIFYPLLELPPGKPTVVVLSRNLGEQWSGTVTGTGTDAANNTIRLRANGAACDVSVEAYDR